MNEAAARGQRLLIVEADRAVRRQLSALAAELGRDEDQTASLGEALARLATGEFAAVLAARELPGCEPLAALHEIRAHRPGLPVVLVAQRAETAVIAQGIRAGARDFLCPPFEAQQLARALERCAAAQALAPRQEAAPPQALFAAPGLRMRVVLRRIEAVAGTDLTVLIRGESGTGKELVARALCAGSARRARPFVKVGCAAIPDELLESELFGYEKGAFTGAARRRAGRFCAAHGGTIFLDEIAELSPRLQAKLLQVLQDGQFARLGSECDAAVDVRVIAATHADLEARVAAGSFRDDLYYRLNVVSIALPPLRERADEILPLAGHFARHWALEFAREAPELGPELCELMLAYPWPGNVRELENLIKRLVVQGGEAALAEELRARLARAPAARAPESLERYLAGETPTLDLKRLAREAAQRAEAEAIARVLARTQGNRRAAAQMLQISYKALLYKMRDAGLARVPPQA